MGGFLTRLGASEALVRHFAAECIDGEALLWAHNRLIGRPEQRKILMMISDGAPVDDSTLSVNPGNYLERHLRGVIELIETRSPVVVVSVLRDLTHRQGLAAAISGRDEASLEPLVAFLARYTTSPRYASLLCEVCHVVLDLYAHALGQSEPIDELLMKLHRQLNAEVILHREMFAVRGLLETVSARAVAVWRQHASDICGAQRTRGGRQGAARARGGQGDHVGRQHGPRLRTE